MKKIFIPILAVLVLGCDDVLQKDSVSPNLNTTSTFFKTESDAITSINAAYNALIIDGFYNRMGAVMADARGDELTSRSPWDVLVTVGAFTMPSTSAGAPIIWEGSYILINRANQTITGVTDMVDVDPDLKNRVLGQAHFLRALGHYQLAIYYNEAPIVTKIPVAEEEFYPVSSTSAQLWQQVIDDLSTAKGLLPDSYTDVVGLDKGQNQRVTKGAAQAMLGKAYLYTKQWALAEAEFDDVIESNTYNLAANYTDNFTENPGIERSNPEAIFQVEFTNDLSPELNWGGVPNANWRQFSAIAPTYAARGFGFFDYFPNTWLYNEMKIEQTEGGGTDPRLLATILSYEPDDGYVTAYGKPWLDTPPVGAGYTEDEIFIKKFTRADQGVANDTENLNSGINYPVIRFADVLLMAAEAKNELDNRGDAAPLITRVRTRVNLPDRTAEFAALSQSDFREQIAHERVMEFAIEGSRINDIIRWGWLNDPAKLAELKAHDIEWSTYQPGKEYLPIPQVELDRNKNLKKNSAN